MGDYRLSVEISLAPANDDKFHPLKMWINYHEERKEKLLQQIGDYLDEAWLHARMNMEEDFLERERAAKIARRKAEIIEVRAQLAQLESEDASK
jgi:hypothetical protein